MELYFVAAHPIVKKFSRYNREKLELLWDIRVGTLVETCTKNLQSYHSNHSLSCLSFCLW